MKKIICILAIVGMMAGCDFFASLNEDDHKKTLAVGKFKLSGSAQTGQYAMQLQGIGERLAGALAVKEGWQVVESDRITELVKEQSYSNDADFTDTLSRLVGEKPGADTAIFDGSFPSADYILVGEMRGLDVSYKNSPSLVGGGVKALNNRERVLRTQLSYRIVDVKSRSWFYSQDKVIEVAVLDVGSAESQIEKALNEVMAKAVVTLEVVDESASLSAKTDNQETVFSEPIRLAFGGLNFAKPTSRYLDVNELEQKLTYILNNVSGLQVINQDAKQLKQLINQQALTDFSKDRVPGLPAGTLTGVDYLVFGSIYDYSVVEKKKRYNASYDIYTGGGYDVTLRMYLYLQDVNTAQYATNHKLELSFSLEDNKSDIDYIALERLSNQAISKLLTTIRPLEILHVSADSVLLNHGKYAGLNINDKLTVSSVGEVVVDKYTGSPIANVGAKKLGVIKIVSFNPVNGLASATLVDSDIAGLSAGLKLSLLDEKPVNQPQNKKKIEEVRVPSW